MIKIPRRLLVFGALVFAALAVFALSPLAAQRPAQATAVDPQAGAAAPPAGSLTEAEITAHLLSAPAAPAPEVYAAVNQDNCLHCHLSGEDRNVWTPVSRWGVFGMAGLLFAFGMYRSASTWITRRAWKPLSLRAADWIDERYDIRKPLEKLLSKPVPTYATRWFYCLGGITALLFVVQGITGIMLAVYYKPTPDAAYASIQFIENEVRFGAAIRAIHHWAANGMIVMCIAHMIRVFITGAFRPPREMNWVGGTLLLIMTLAFGFTGYLLPWDQRAFWATTVGTDIAGGIPDVGPLALIFLRAGWTVTEQTLSRFFAAHVLILPVLTIALMGLHFLMVRRQGIAKPL